LKKRIVITDDDPGIQDIFRIILERAGYDVEVITNGLDMLKNQFKLPDLFILDKQLSGVDGLRVCEHLKKQKSTKRIPVIMVSANPNIHQLARDAGADDFIGKPFEIDSLLNKVRDHLTPPFIQKKNSIGNRIEY
jgi:DNA-binding response OmpR family regulator